MLPRWHIFLGALFTLLVWILSPEINKLYLVIIFLSSFLLDIDHYLVAVRKNNHFSLFKALHYFKLEQVKELREKSKGIKRRGHFFFLHTIEFHLLIGILGLFYTPLFFAFIGMLFHSFLDIADMLEGDRLYRREFSFFSWAMSRKSS